MERINGTLMNELSLLANTRRIGRASNDMLVFVTEGSLLFTAGPEESIPYEKGALLSIPRGTAYQLRIVEKVKVLVFYLQTGKEIPARFFPFPLNKKSGRKGYHVPVYSKLTMDSRLWSLVDTIRPSLKEMKSNHEYLSIKLFELCSILRAGYGRKEGSAFFRPILSHDHSFADFVMENYLKVSRVSELVALSPYSMSAFKRHFTAAFGEAPYHWMKRQKGMRILYLIHYTSLSFTEISAQTGFSSLPQFTAFCRINFGEAPNVIRKNGPVLLIPRQNSKKQSV